MAHNDQNVSKFENLVYLSQKIPIVAPNHSVIIYRYGVWPKNCQCLQLRACKGPKMAKKGLKMTQLTLYQKLMKNNENLSSKPWNINEYRLSKV